MSSGGAIPPPFNSFSPFGYLFQPQTQPAFAAHQQRLKIKRHRQRVDAGEPRNTYQGKSSRDLLNESLMNGTWMNSGNGGEGGAGDAGDAVTEPAKEQPTDLSCKGVSVTDDVDALLDVDVLDDKDDDDDDVESHESNKEATTTTPTSRESPSSTSSASKRKSFQPQKIGDLFDADEVEALKNDLQDDEEVLQKAEDKKTELSALQAQLSQSPTKFPTDVFEAQKKLYNALMEQQRKLLPTPATCEERKMDYGHLVQTLKNEIIETLSTSIERVVRDWANTEILRQTNEFRQQHQHQQQQMHPIFPMPNASSLPFSMAHGLSSGIFPSSFNAFNPLHAFNALRRSAAAAVDDDAPKKKKPKLQNGDFVRKDDASSVRGSSPFSTPDSPQMGHTTPNMSLYRPPTLVGHPLYGGVTFGERDDSPTNSDELSDCGQFEGGHSSTLTPMHLRKAKLMFFYTRYPNSNLLKSYFPDIRFNKNNTAQLVKWFSNFREFYYIQMEKFARQLLAEGVKRREEIFVTTDSELFKALNTHYNRNNHIQPPEKLVYVVQESLREFFDAIRLGKDTEPSWKKTIYKVINRLDDAIPEYFKDPNFLERLDS